MSDNEIEKKVIIIRGLISTYRAKTRAWNEIAPQMEQADEQLSIIEESIGNSPSPVSMFTSEDLLDYLDKAKAEFQVVEDIPDPPAFLNSTVSTTSSATSVAYTNFVNEVDRTYQGNPEVSLWVDDTLRKEQHFRKKQRRSQVVQTRLRDLRPDLATLHDDAINTTLSCKAGIHPSVEAAETLTRLLDQFRGALIDKCRATGKGTSYQRIADVLAVDRPLTKTELLTVNRLIGCLKTSSCLFVRK